MMAKDLIIVLEHTILPGRYADYSLSSAAMEKLFTKAGAFSRQGSSTTGRFR